MSVKKWRLDVLLLEKGFFSSREKARAAIMAGRVFVDGECADKPGRTVAESAALEVRGNPVPYVSRGGLKLEKAIRVFGLDLAGKVVLDIGASTGGFTDCALKHGAKLVYAVDVGYGQLAWTLREDPRVVVLERTNIRRLSAAALPERPDFVTVDVSFISLKLVLPKAGELARPGAEGVALIKPQFEAGREKVGKKGVVRDKAVHTGVIASVAGSVIQMGWSVAGLDYSPVKGPEGNIEFLLYFKMGAGGCPVDIRTVVERAHAELA
ncbi:MAG: TlyA family RNA methyltransferase [Firmicutes bacterium]|nr:TlyA family RNA methyltransferase [Bacillota bacterium]